MRKRILRKPNQLNLTRVLEPFSMAFSLSRKLSRAILSPIIYSPSNSSLSFCTETILHTESDSDSPETPPHRANTDRPLENGLDYGVYKAILVGKTGQPPIQKRLKSGKLITLISLGTGGIRNNRRPLDNEGPREYANRCAVQWHRVCVYPEGLGLLALKSVGAGSILYVEGNLESKVFSDPITGLVRRIREVAVRRNGRILVLGDGGGGVADTFTKTEVAGVGYY